MGRAHVRPRRAVAATLLTATLACAGCGRATNTTAGQLHPCAVDEGPADTLCGRLTVFEDRAAGRGRTIDLKIVVAPALRRDAATPLFVVEGGPGRGAATKADEDLLLFRHLQSDRDIVFVDQRGSGASNPLDCKARNDQELTLVRAVEYPVDHIRECLERFDADLRLYTTPLAMDDLDDVRRALGYDRINLWGASYGASAALVYLARHEAAVRSVVLDSVPPLSIRPLLNWARNGQRALDRLISDCAADAACNDRFPDLRKTVEAALMLASQQPTVRLRHPLTGDTVEGPVSRELIAGIVFGVLYSPVQASLLPQLLTDAAHGDFQGLASMALLPPGPASGLFLSVHCSESVGVLTRDEIVRSAEGTLFGTIFMDTVFKPCAFWPRAAIDPSLARPVSSDKPVLVLSGAEDPVTPPDQGEQAASTLVNARHLVVPGTGHMTSATGCVPMLIDRFLESADARALDASCLNRLHRPPFVARVNR